MSGSGCWPLSWRQLQPPDRLPWFESLWQDVCMLRERYRLKVRSGWWEDEIQVEALAALADWAGRYDSGEWDDPAGKLALLYDLQRVAELLAPGLQPFSPDRDRGDFERYVRELAASRLTIGPMTSVPRERAFPPERE